MRFTLCYGIFLLFLTCHNSHATPRIDDISGSINLNSNLRYLQNTKDKLSLEEALQTLHKGEFVGNNSAHPINFGYDRSDFWFYVDFETTEAARRVLYLPYPYHQNMDVYINTDGSWQKIRTGNLQLFDTRGDFQPESFAWPFDFEANSTVKVLINVNSRSPVIMSVQLQSVDHYITSSNTRNLFYGMFFGILIIMLVYNLFLYAIIRDAAYLHYVILVLANISVFAAVSGYAFHYLYPENPQINFYIREVLIAFLIIPTSLFAISFLDLKRYSILLYNTLRVMIALGVVLTTLMFFGITFGFSSLIISIHAPLLLLTGIVVRIKGNTAANFYILAWTGYLLGGTAMTLRNGGFLPANFVTDHGAEIGAVLDVLLLALALAYRYKKVRNERSKLHEANLELVEKQNVLLEKKVKERTSQLDSTLEIVQKQHNDLNLKNSEINSSINYALTIQEAMFPGRDRMLADFKEITLFQKPKQTVSGDFMFFENINNHLYVAVVDCTGHGVPGALMSMAGYNLFYDAINVEKLSSPAEILTFVEKNLHLRLHQKDRIVKDGMEVALCVINKKTREAKFCGAQRPLLVINKEGDINLIKGTKQAIGGDLQNLESTFHEHTLPLAENTTLYLYSDGFQDQFGGEHDKKFLSKRLVDLLSTISKHPGQKQEQILETEFEQWKGSRDQIDDVLILGVRV